MKRMKTLCILCGILVVAVIAILIEKAVKNHIDSINIIDEEVFSISEEDITSLTFEYGDDTVTLNNADDGWTYDEDADFPVDQEYVQELLSYFESVHASFIIDDVEDYSQYGIDSPEATITFTTEDSERKITFGTFSTIDEKRYICVDDGSVYLIDEDILADISADVDDYLDRDEVYGYSQLTELTVSGDGNVDVVYDPDGEYTYTDDYDYYAVDGDNYLALSESLVTSYVETLSNMDLTEYITYKAGEDDLSKYGLDSPSLTITLTGEVPADDSDDAVESKTQTIYVSLQEDDDIAYLYFEGSTIVYGITVDTYEDLADASYETLRPTEVVSLDWTNVAQIVTIIDGETNIIDVEYDEDDGNAYTIDGETVDFINARIKIDGITLDEVGSDYDTSTEELEVTIILNDDDATEVNIAFYQYDGDSCVVTVNGEVQGLCSRNSMSTLREEITSAILNKGKEIEEEDETSSEDYNEDYSDYFE